MSKKKKNKIKTLTDQQYNDYLMALKDERPVMVADKDGNLHPQHKKERNAFAFRSFLFASRKLRIIQMIVKSFFREQFRVRPLLDDGAVVHHQNGIRVQYGR